MNHCFTNVSYAEMEDKLTLYLCILFLLNSLFEGGALARVCMATTAVFARSSADPPIFLSSLVFPKRLESS